MSTMSNRFQRMLSCFTNEIKSEGIYLELSHLDTEIHFQHVRTWPLER